jgi:hypothetical protein
MSKKAISVTLETENLTWLQGRVGATGLRSVSGLLDRLVTEARSHGSVGPIASVVGTIDIDATDSLLRTADDAVRGLVEGSLDRPLRASEGRVSYRTTTPPAGAGPGARAAGTAGRLPKSRKRRRA